MATAQDVLVDVRALLSTRMRWAKGAAAYDLSNHEVSPEGPLAVRWSLPGAIVAVGKADSDAQVEARRALQVAIEQSDSRMSIYRFNEVASHEELLELLDSVIGAVGKLGRAAV